MIFELRIADSNKSDCGLRISDCEMSRTRARSGLSDSSDSSDSSDRSDKSDWSDRSEKSDTQLISQSAIPSASPRRPQDFPHALHLRLQRRVLAPEGHRLVQPLAPI